MAYAFGQISAGKITKKALQAEVTKTLLVDHYRPGGDYYIFLFECEPKKVQLEGICAEIERAGFYSYVVLAALNCHYNTEQKGNKTDYIAQHESPWREWLTKYGRSPRAIMTFGAALYSVNKGVDISWIEFRDSQFTPPYYYLGDKWIDKYNCFIYPVDSVEWIYPERPFDGGRTNFTTRIFKERLGMMMRGGEIKPDDSPYYFHDINSREEFAELMERNKGLPMCAWDTETTGLDMVNDRIGCMTITFDCVNAYYIPAEYIDWNLFASNMSTIPTIVLANGKFDYKMAWSAGLPLSSVWTDDIMVLAHALSSERHTGLKPQAFFWTAFGGYEYKKDILIGKMKEVNYMTMDEDTRKEYACMDAIVTGRVYKALLEAVRKADREMPNDKPTKEWTIEGWYRKLLMPATTMFAKIEFKGVYIRKDRMDAYREECYKVCDECEEALCKIWNVPRDFPFSSADKLGDFIEHTLKWPCYERNEKGGYATGAASLEVWRRDNLPGINELIKWKEYNTLLKTYLGLDEDIEAERARRFIKNSSGFGSITQTQTREKRSESLFDDDEEDDNEKGWLQYLRYHEDEGLYRIHTNFSVMGAASFRNKSREPNFQNLPSHTKSKYMVLGLIQPPPLEVVTVTNDSGEVFEGMCYELVETKERGIVRMDDLTESDTVLRKWHKGDPVPEINKRKPMVSERPVRQIMAVRQVQPAVATSQPTETRPVRQVRVVTSNSQPNTVRQVRAVRQ